MTNLLLAREHWCESVDLGQRLDVVFIDFSKAFDRVPHRRLHVKLEGLRIREPLLGSIRVFITERPNRVMGNGALSSSVIAASCVPQGSVLGPFLFKDFVHDIPHSVSVDCLLFADDLKLWGS